MQMMHEGGYMFEIYACKLTELLCDLDVSPVYRFFFSFYSSDNAVFTNTAVAKKTEPMGGMPSMLSSQQPGKDASRSEEEGEKWSPSSSPTNKPAAGEIVCFSFPQRF